MGRTSNDNISLESTTRHVEIGPPSYDDVVDTPCSTPAEESIPGAWSVDWDEQLGTVTQSSSLTGSPSSLYRLIAQQAQLPPRQYVHIKGFKGKGSDSRDRQTDFDFSLELTPTLLRLDEDSSSSEWHELRVVRDGDGQQAFRGGMAKSLHWEEPSRPKDLGETTGLGDEDRDAERQTLLSAAVDGPDEGTPTLMGWCERFCRDPASVKSFTFTRELSGFDVDPVRSELKAYLRSLNYRGHIEITTSIPNGFVTVYSPHWINRLRNNSFVWWLCILLQLWIVTLPVIILLERRYQVVHSVWRSSRRVEDATAPSGQRKVYAHGRDATKLADFWAAAVVQAAWDQLDGGEVLTESDLPRLQRRAQERMERIGRSVQSDRNTTGPGSATENTQTGWHGPAIPGVGAGEYNFQAGWCGNSRPMN